MKNLLFKKLISSTMAALVLFPTMGNRVAADPGPKTYKVVIVGDSGVGKTLIVNKVHFGDKVDTQSIEATIGADFFREPVGNHQLNIWDTAGLEMYRSISVAYAANSRIFVITANLKQTSVKAIEEWLEIRRRNCPLAKVVFVINEYAPPCCSATDKFGSGEEVERGIRGLYENRGLGELNICHVDLSKRGACDQLLAKLGDLASQCAE
ncbi:MAG: GTP-binding protein [Oscillospiraceae bacterium]|jgi:hypothetical protein|nr:GTP-binding protein [Oscillospiraceae bacterium]